MPRPDPNRPRRWQAILRRLPTGVPLYGAEIGVWMGRTAKELLAARPMLRHVMIDSWEKPPAGSAYADSPDRIAQNDQPYFDRCYEQTLAEVAPFGNRAIVHRMWSIDAVELFDGAVFDYVFIDAEHTYAGVKQDIGLWLPKVKPGGWIGGHDYGNLPRFPGVAAAVDEWFGDAIELDGDCTWFHAI